MLRAYQADIYSRCVDAWNSGLSNVMPVCATGSGKTVIMSHAAAEHDGPGVAMAHRSVLIGQISQALARQGLVHDIIGQKSVVRTIVNAHMDEFGRSYYNPSAHFKVASVDTMPGRASELSHWIKRVTLGITDEAHHVLSGNKWGRECLRFENARWMLPTATPERADRKGLGRDADGIADVIVEGPPMRWLINNGYLTDYIIRAPMPADLDLSDVEVNSSGEYNQKQLRRAVHRSTKIIGNVVDTYLQNTAGMLGIVFAVDIEHAKALTAEFNTKGVRAELITADHSEEERRAILKRYRDRETLVLVNVDLFGEGFDLPAIEVVMMARPTASYSLYCMDPETEVLTPSGWEKWNTALNAKEVLAFDPRDGLTKRVPVTGQVKRPMLDHEVMYGIKSPHLDLLVSDKHRLLVKATSNTAKHWKFEEAETASMRGSMFRIPVAAECDNEDCGLSDAELHFLGWFQSDGTLNKHTGAIQISQSISKAAHLVHIRATIEGCGFKYGETAYRRKNVPPTHNDQVVFSISRGDPRGTDKHLSGWARLAPWIDKSLPEVYDSMSSRDLRVMLEAWNMGDGWNHHDNVGWTPRTLRITCGDNKRMADRLQQLCVTRGLRCNISTVAPRGTAWHICFIKDTRTTTIAGIGDKDATIGDKKPYKRSRLEKSEERPDFVWCLTNPLGTLITRRNGKVSIVGNCQQFGRGLRLMINPIYMAAWETYTPEQRLAIIAQSNKPVAHIHDHVGNVLHFFGPPDKPREWSLERVTGARSSGPSDAIPLRVCSNNACVQPFERFYPSCPYCGTPVPVPPAASLPEEVDGDITLYTPEMLQRLFGVDNLQAALDRKTSTFCAVPPGLPPGAVRSIQNKHHEKLKQQAKLQQLMPLVMPPVVDDRQNMRKFFLRFGVDVVQAKLLGGKETADLNEKIIGVLTPKR